MDGNSNVRYVDTTKASVRMTGGVPLINRTVSDSSTDVDSQSEAEEEQEKSAVRIRNKQQSVQSHISKDKEYEGKSSHQRPVAYYPVSSSSTYIKTTHNNDVAEMISSTNGNESSKMHSSNISVLSQKNISLHCENIRNAPSRHISTKSKQDSPHGSEQRGSVVDHPVSVGPTNLPSVRETHIPDNYHQHNTENGVVTLRVKARNSSFKSGNVVTTSRSRIKITSSSSSQPRGELKPERLSQSLENTQGPLQKPLEAGLKASNSMHVVSGHQKVRQRRSNPFNDGLLLDEDHFSDSYDNYFRGDRGSNSSTKSSTVSQGADWWQDSDVTFAELGLSEDHFSHPKGHFGLTRAEELELAIENCKEMIQGVTPGSDKQKNLVQKLVQLRIKLQEVKEGPDQVPENVKVIMSHKMMLKNSRSSKYYCERCNGAIWGMLQAWYRCSECGYRCHEKCLQQILRTCARTKVHENPTLITEICPKETNGLTGQNFRCSECRQSVSFKSGQPEPRMCDYTGQYYCDLCHWNDTFIIPARVLHNWDFSPRRVCRASKQFLKLMHKKAVIRIQDINPLLFNYVEQLTEIKKLREEMMIMKKYIISCTVAMSAKLLLLLENRQHFVESSDRYSMQDLLDAEQVLLPELVAIHSSWAQHIKVDCQLCQGRGFICEICADKEVLFPFDNTAVVCAKCSTVLHRRCFSRRSACPRCERRGRRPNVDS